ncbi:unnamed protein product [Calypogeia fissa]
MDEDVKQVCSGGVVAPIILYSDQTSLSNNKRTQGWPVVMTIGNISCNMRTLPEGHSLMAVLPVLGADDQGLQESRMPSRAKLEILHQCQEIILAPLKEASYKGVHLKDPFGNSQWVFPRLCLYICDQTEGSRMTCTFDTNKCKFPCSCCFCPKKSLSAVAKTFPYRSELRMREIFNEMVQSPLEEKERLCKAQSVHPVKCALWGFSGSNLCYGNAYRSVQVDRLHQSILGVFKILVGIVGALRAPSTLVAHPLRELDKRLKIIHKHCRYASFRLPGSNQGGYFQSNANFHGFEHKYVMQVVAFCLLGVVSNSVIQVFVHFLDWYLLAFQSKKHSESSLNEMDRLMRKSVGSMKKHVKIWQKSGFDIVKIHAMTHLKDCIKRYGLPMEYDTGVYEYLHIALMKLPYRHSNKGNFLGQIVQHNQKKRILLDEADLQEELHVQVGDVTALDKAVETGEVTFSGKDQLLILNWLASSEEGTLPMEAQELLGDQPELKKHLMQALGMHLGQENCTFPEAMQLYNSIAVPAGEGDRFGDWPMYTRASRRFHGQPWFGYVSLQMEAAGSDPITWIGQLRLLFSCEVRDGEGKKVLKHLASVRLMQKLSRDAECNLLGCVKLKWVEEAIVHTMSSRKNEDMHLTLAYIVIDVANVASVVHVVPNFAHSGTYFLNRFKI